MLYFFSDFCQNPYREIKYRHMRKILFILFYFFLATSCKFLRKCPQY